MNHENQKQSSPSIRATIEREAKDAHGAGARTPQGITNDGTRKTLDEKTLTRFLKKVRVTDCGCWLWTAGTRRGYGQFAVFFGKTSSNINAHRISYEHFIAIIPDGMQIDHLCRTKNCVNPSHLEPVSQFENQRRALPYLNRTSWPEPPPTTPEERRARNARRRREYNRQRYQKSKTQTTLNP